MPFSGPASSSVQVWKNQEDTNSWGRKPISGLLELTLVPLLTILGLGPRVSGNWRPSFSSTSQGTRGELHWRWQCRDRPAMTQKASSGPQKARTVGALSSSETWNPRLLGNWARPAVEVGGGAVDRTHLPRHSLVPPLPPPPAADQNRR